MFPEDDLLPTSALQHLAFCERQWGLIHLEQIWTENVLTAQGRVLHERAHDAQSETRGDTCTARAVRLRSLAFGLSGIADVVEFHRLDPAQPPAQPPLPPPDPRPSDPTPPVRPGVVLPGHRGRWQPFPVEYKRGKPKSNRCDEIQLCAQALCLEEMLGCPIPRGALFYGQPRRRTDVAFDAVLRGVTGRLAARMHELFAAGITPAGIYEKKCKSCSLLELCRPEKIRPGHSAARFLDRQLADLEEDEGP